MRNTVAMKLIAISLLTILTLSLSSCGTILYPERRGQTSGRIDPAVAILDGVGLIVFLVPGLIAFAIDFATGTIYLPHGRRANSEDIKIVRFDPQSRSPRELGRIVAEETGKSVDFARQDIEAYVVEPGRDLAERLRQLGGEN